MSNRLAQETSPYLLQHAENPVDWYPWGNAAFQKARDEDKPIFLSIGYSTCHWCHVMAHESFEDAEIAEILNEHFISVKVDREERPDVDSIYMTVCQTLTGSGGWPTSIFMTAEQKPFFAGTYFPKTSRYGSVGLKELLLLIHAKWQEDRVNLLRSAEEITLALRREPQDAAAADERLLNSAMEQYRRSFDAEYGGFGRAPKFPTPHNLLFLLQQYEKHGDTEALHMAEVTLKKMYLGGLFDHIGYGFSRYSTDRKFLVPHFEKMLYDNALLILAYCKAHAVTGKQLYRSIAEKTAIYVLEELRADSGAFFSAQDADSDGEEGKFYVFTPDEIESVLGEQDGATFCACFDITPQGNFEGKNIPNLLRSDAEQAVRFDILLPKLRAYRKTRTWLHRDEKILTAWNGLMIAALCALYRCTKQQTCLDAAKEAMAFLTETLSEDDTQFVSFCDGKRGEKGFLDDYASVIYALLALYDATLETAYLDRAEKLAEKTVASFFDAENGGFYLSGSENEALIFRPKECYDGAIPSGNSLMAYNLVRLQALRQSDARADILEKHLACLAGEAMRYPAGHAMFLLALSEYLDPSMTVTVVGAAAEERSELPLLVPSDASIIVLSEATEAYALLDGQTAYYVCQNKRCLAPMRRERFLKYLQTEKTGAR